MATQCQSPRELLDSRQLGNASVQGWKESKLGGRVIARDLGKTALTFVDLDWIAGASTSILLQRKASWCS